MRPMEKAAILWNDRRSYYIARGLQDAFPSATILCRGVQDSPCDLVRAADLVVLPLPMSRDGVHLAESGEEPFPLSILFACGRRGSLWCGGNPSVFYTRLAKESGFRLADYFAGEEVQIANAVPTAEGAIGIAIQMLPVTLAGCKAAVVGYGRCAQAIARRLLSLGCSVVAAARKRTALAQAAADGCSTILLEDFCALPPPCRIVFNTIPAPVLTAQVTERFPSDCLVVEIASGTVVGEEAQKRGVRLYPAPGLPGHTAPETAGNILCREIIRLWEEDTCTKTE